MASSLNSFNLIRYWYCLWYQQLSITLSTSHFFSPSISIKFSSSSVHCSGIRSLVAAVSLTIYNTRCNLLMDRGSFNMYDIGHTMMSMVLFSAMPDCNLDCFHLVVLLVYLQVSGSHFPDWSPPSWILFLC